jgi:hypothetical protein
MAKQRRYRGTPGPPRSGAEVTFWPGGRFIRRAGLSGAGVAAQVFLRTGRGFLYRGYKTKQGRGFAPQEPQ